MIQALRRVIGRETRGDVEGSRISLTFIRGTDAPPHITNSLTGVPYDKLLVPAQAPQRQLEDPAFVDGCDPRAAGTLGFDSATRRHLSAVGRF